MHDQYQATQPTTRHDAAGSDNDCRAGQADSITNTCASVISVKLRHSVRSDDDKGSARSSSAVHVKDASLTINLKD